MSECETCGGIGIVGGPSEWDAYCPDCTTVNQPCDVHYWEAVDRHEDVYRCRYCRATWSLDDPPDGPAA